MESGGFDSEAFLEALQMGAHGQQLMVASNGHAGHHAPNPAMLAQGQLAAALAGSPGVPHGQAWAEGALFGAMSLNCCSHGTR